jgi:hypothetical protein
MKLSERDDSCLKTSVNQAMVKYHSDLLKSGVWAVLVMMAVVACGNQPSPTFAVFTSPVDARQIPAMEQFTRPAEGTLLPPGTSYAQTLNLPSGSSGVLFVNKTGALVHVAISDTLATIPVGQVYLFVLSPGRYEFYIYGIADTPLAHIEQTEAEKVRYVYLMPFSSKPPLGG